MSGREQAMDYEQILYHVEDGFLTITLNRPERMNAFTYQMRDELLDAFGRAACDDAVRAVILTGAGRAFCAGADLAGGDKALAGDDAEWRDGGGMVTLAMFGLNKPIVAAINGAAAGIGATLCLAADVRIASENAKFGFVFARRGVVLESCASWFLPRIVGIEQALRWSMSGRVFPAAEALAGRLVSETLAPEDLPARARAICAEMTEETSAVSVALIRQMLWRMAGASHPMEAHRVESSMFGAMGASADAAEGVASFLEKRPATFTMKPSADMPAGYPWWEEPSYKPGPNG
jgi:enoyl-CoA hydratase/carnithine racemase